MTYAILVVTPSAAFGDLIRQSLARNGDFGVQTCQSADEALVLCRSTLFAIAILDGDLANQSLPRLGHEILRCCPGVRLAVFPPDNNPKSPALAGGVFQAFLKKPFYLPTLLKTLKKLLAETAQSVAAESSADILEDKQVLGDALPEGRDCSPALAGGARVAEAARKDGQDSPAETARNEERDCFAEAARNDREDSLAETARKDGQIEKESPAEGEGNLAETAWPEPILPTGGLLPDTPEDEPPDADPANDLEALEKLMAAWIGPEAMGQTAQDGVAPFDHPEALSPLQPAGEAARGAPAPGQNQAAADSHVKDTQPTHITPPEAVQAITCALTPLLAEHYLRSDQMNALRKSMLEISAAQEWQIVWLSIRPSHVAWTVSIPASVAPETMVKAYRHATSEGLFRTYPSLGYQNPSGDFWSPGCLLSPGERSLTRQSIYEFVAAFHPSSFIPHP